MSRNQQSSWHYTRQKDILSVTPVHLEVVSERATDLELCTPETLRRTQEELQWYRSLYENTPSVYFTLDATGKILSVNQFGADSLGYRREQLIQTSIFNLFEESDKQRLSNAFKELLTVSPESEITNWEFRLNARKIVWVKIAARILPTEEANPLILMVCEDITAQKQTEDLLRESEQRFHTMADTAPVMLWMSGSDSLCNFFNQSWLNFTGRSLEQEQGLGWLENVHPEDQDFCFKTYESAFNARAKFKMEYRLKRHDGNYRWILDSGVPRSTSTGNFAGYIGSCIDITERKLTEVALQETQEAAQAQFDEIESLNRLKDEFLSTVSHELRTPLTNMKMAIQMLGISLKKEQNFLLEIDKPETERSKAARYFQILDNECDREINLINNFLDLQKLDNVAKPLVLETIQLQQWLCRVLQVFQARNRNISQQELQINIAANLPPLTCDPFSLERILIELLTNACKFSPPEAQITLSAQLKSKQIQFQVINTGVEIPTTEIPLIFNKFYRIPSNDPWKQGGTGLGLALVQKLTLSLGGTIEVESQSNCTCFTILLPVSSEG
ncbi:PAS domain-containing sensor histidine kinase [Hassallia byssoidea VB512170]|uniref:histidine kinase n=1 Tax=Hassallia byssoidea VB512170 TaxID=1304833 RepID=A0A846H8B8_9CYAN|nr:PAS domain-containing sensor histidine kinase [Hassalia byssoidea]NEU72939.1 PAS domain-containing sensor histidine kinase [Hassalia byssoidea VB512170]